MVSSKDVWKTSISLAGTTSESCKKTFPGKKLIAVKPSERETERDRELVEMVIVVYTFL